MGTFVLFCCLVNFQKSSTAADQSFYQQHSELWPSGCPGTFLHVLYSQLCCRISSIYWHQQMFPCHLSKLLQKVWWM